MSEDYDVVAEAEAILSSMEESNELNIDLSDEYVKAAIQIYERIGRPLTEEEATAIFREVTELFVSAALWRGWEHGVVTMGFNDGEITWWRAS